MIAEAAHSPMELHSGDGIILDVLDLHDYDRIVAFLTRGNGKKRGVARGARRKHSRFGGQLQPLAKVKITWSDSRSSELVRISSVEMLRPAVALQDDLEGLMLSAYLRDHMLEFAQEDEPEDHLFRLLDSTIEAILAGIDRDLATRYFEAWMLRLAGVFPAPESCPICESSFEAREAVLPSQSEGLTCRDCGGPGAEHLDPGVLDFLRAIGRRNLSAMSRQSWEPATLAGVDRLCAQIRRRFLQRELRSYQVIRETLAAVPGSSRTPR